MLLRVRKNSFLSLYEWSIQVIRILSDPKRLSRAYVRWEFVFRFLVTYSFDYMLKVIYRKIFKFNESFKVENQGRVFTFDYIFLSYAEIPQKKQACRIGKRRGQKGPILALDLQTVHKKQLSEYLSQTMNYIVPDRGLSGYYLDIDNHIFNVRTPSHRQSLMEIWTT